MVKSWYASGSLSYIKDLFDVFQKVFELQSLEDKSLSRLS